MIQIHKTPVLVRKAYPSLTWDRSSKDEIFLTFDDGPHPEVTRWVLEELGKFGAMGTFFCVGENIRKYRSTAEEVVAQGHLIGNHTQNHLKGWNTTTAKYLENVAECEEEIVGVQPQSASIFRPPYGRIKKAQVKALRTTYQIVMWSHLSWDFDRQLDVQKSLRNLRKAGPGSIVVFHDSNKAFKNLKALLPEMLTYWASLGYKFRTLQ